jgi:hypothetical protein
VPTGTRYSRVPFVILTTYRVEVTVKLSHYNKIVRQESWLNHAVRAVPEVPWRLSAPVEQTDEEFKTRVRTKIEYIAFRPPEEFKLYLTLGYKEHFVDANTHFLINRWSSERYFLFYHEGDQPFAHQAIYDISWDQGMPILMVMISRLVGRSPKALPLTFDALVCHSCRGGVYTGVSSEHYNIWRIPPDFDLRKLF